MFVHDIGEGLELFILEEKHAEELYALTDSNRVHLRQWLPWVDATRSPEDSKSFIKAGLQQLASGNGFHAGIRYHGKLAGVIGFPKFDHNNRIAIIGYWLGKEYTGKGIMTKSCAAMIDYAFNDVGMNRVEIYCATDNLKSRAIPERLGFKQEGIIRDAEWLYDHYVDGVIYGMLARDRAEKDRDTG